MDFRDYIKILKRRKIVIIASSAFVLVSYVFLIFQRPFFYEARSSIMLTEVSLQERILRSLSTVTPQSVSMNSQLQLMRSKRFSKLVVKKLKTAVLQTSPVLLSDEEAARAVSMQRISDTNLIEITAQSKDARIAKSVAKAYAEVSVSENDRIANREFKKAKDFVAVQLRHAEQRLKKARNALHAFNQSGNVIDFEQALLDAQQKITAYQSSLEQLEMESQEKKFLVAQLYGKLQKTPNMTLSNSIIPNQLQTDMEGQLLTLEMQLLDLREKYTGAHPKVAAVENKISRINKELKTKVSRFVTVPTYSSNPAYYYTYQQLTEEELSLIGLNIKFTAVTRILSQSQEDISRLSKKQLEYEQLSQEAKTAERMYNNLLDMFEQMKVSQATKLGNAQVVDLPDSAVKVSKTSGQNIIFIVLLSLMCGFACGVAMEFFDDVIRSAHDVRRVLNLPVLGSIPKVPELKGDQMLPIISDEKSHFAEAFHKVGYQVQSLCFDAGAKSLLFTSSMSGEGKTTVISNLAYFLAASGESVLVVDGDIRRPTLHRIFQVDNTLGLSNILSGELQEKGMSIEQALDATLKRVGQERLLLLPSGPTVRNPVELLRSARMQEVVTCLKQKTSLLLMDSSPLIAVIDPVIEASYLDGVVFIVDSSKTRRKEALHSKQLLTNLKLRVLGVILNQVMIEEEDYYYYYYYSNYGQRRKKPK